MDIVSWNLWLIRATDFIYKNIYIKLSDKQLIHTKLMFLSFFLEKYVWRKNWIVFLIHDRL